MLDILFFWEMTDKVGDYYTYRRAIFLSFYSLQKN